MEAETIARQVRSFFVWNFLGGQDDRLTDSDSLLETGIIDSAGVLELIAFLDATYGIEIEDSEVTPDNLGSIDSIAGFLHSKLNFAGDVDVRAV